MYLEKQSGSRFWSCRCSKNIAGAGEWKIIYRRAQIIGYVAARQILIMKWMLVKMPKSARDIENWLNKFLVKYVGFSDAIFIFIVLMKIVVKYYIIHII